MIQIDEVLQYLGLVTLTYAIVRTVHRVLRNVSIFWLSGGDKIDFREYGSWAVVTGGTDGMGRCFVDELAKRGLNIVIISNEQHKFDSLKSFIENRYYDVKTRFIYADFSDAQSIYSKIKSELADLDIGVLVNNVGICYEHGMPFDEFVKRDNENDSKMININLVSTTKMTAIVLPNMLKKKNGKSGVIINMSSVAAEVPSPFVAVYSATKAYVDFFSRALSLEYSASHGLIVLSVRPYFVSTRMVSIKSNLIVPTPGYFVRNVFKHVGAVDQTNGCMMHNFGSWVSNNPLVPNICLKMFVSFSSNWFKKAP